jgi:para-aminobenzoate synthetase component I
MVKSKRMSRTIRPLPNLGSVREVFARLRSRPGATLLESSAIMTGMGRWSYIITDPAATLEARGNRTTFQNETWSDPFTALETLLKRYKLEAATDGPDFQGGFIGYLGYDLARHLERLPNRTTNDLNWPEMRLHLADFVLAHDGINQTWYAISLELPGFHSNVQGRKKIWSDILEQAQHGSSEPAKFEASKPISLTPNQMYLEQVERALEYIRAGDIFQVNLSHRLEASFHGDPWALYEHLGQRSPAPFAAYISGTDFTMVSASPERFLRLHNNTLEARPIKGTRARGNTPALDELAKHDLETSLKDRAENLMIVDLLRNDLGRVSRFGSVHTPDLFRLEAHGPVWQMVSTVTGEPREGLGPIDALRASWPGGSMTGAPKIRSMKIIEELEPVRRGPYAGSVGYFDLSGTMDLSIVIRTAMIDHARDRVLVQVGGGIVADSIPQLELEETYAKARAIMECLRQGEASLAPTVDRNNS